MHQTYYYDPEELRGEPDARPAETAAPERPSAGPERVEQWFQPPAPPPKRERSEWGALAALVALILILGGAGTLVAMRLPQIELSLPTLGPGAAVELPLPSVSPQAELERASTGDGTVLTLEERGQGAAKSLQAIYKEVNPAIVSVNAAQAYGMNQGTGVLMTGDGYIITNQHVVADAFRVDVSLDDGRQFQAKLVGADETTDLAVLKVEGKDLPAAVFGDSESLEVGDAVVAIGNPMGEELRGTMTDGILSAINRDMEVNGKSMTLLQTTAALNTGNSGGALVNDQGQVIGITNMKLVSRNAYTATVEGLGFAIPTATVKTVVDELIANGYVTGRPGLGVTVQPLSQEERGQRGLDCGLWVLQVAEGSDAWGKLQEGDILIAADGRALVWNQDLLDVRDGLAVGETLTFQVDREGERLEVTVELVEQHQIYG